MLVLFREGKSESERKRKREREKKERVSVTKGHREGYYVKDLTVITTLRDHLLLLLLFSAYNKANISMTSDMP